MDPRLLAIAAKAAGTYFIVTDNSLVPTNTVPPNLRIIFVNVPAGPVNTVVVFQQGDTAGLASIFGNASRSQEKKGNYSLKTCNDALVGGPIGVVNLRVFTSADIAGIAGISPNATAAEAHTAPYASLFNTNGFWTAQAKNIAPLLSRDNYLNFANVGTSNVSIFVVSSLPINYQSLTSQYSKSLTAMSLSVDDYPGLDMGMLLQDTFVDVYVFANTFNPQTVSTNRYYGQLFNSDGTINLENLPALSLIPEAGFLRTVTGSMLPNLLSESATDLSIDTLMNSLYPLTGVIAHINDDLLETDLTEPPVLNVNATDVYNPDGTLNQESGSSMSILSQMFKEIDGMPTTDLDAVHDADVVNRNSSLLMAVTGTIFQDGNDNQNQILSVYEQGTRIGDEIVFTDADSLETKSVLVTGLQIVQQNVATAPTTKTALAKTVLTINAPTDTISVPLAWTAVTHADTYSVYRKKSTDSSWTLLQAGITALVYVDHTVQPSLTYQYYVLAVNTAGTYVSSISTAKQIITIAADGDYTTIASATSVSTQPADLPTTVAGTLTYSIALLTCSGPINSATYTRKKPFKNIAGIPVAPTALAAYTPRTDQFTDGTAQTQSAILDVMNTPGLVKGLGAMGTVRYVVDAFKSFIEGSYKYQYGQLCLTLDQKNTFARAIINEPFLQDLQKSTNPLFAQGPLMPFDLTYLPIGGNPEYSTVLLSKFAAGSEMSFFFGSGNLDAKGNITPVAGIVSNLFVNKQFAYDVVANASGYLTGITGLEDSPNGSDDRLPYEQFCWNPIIAQKGSFTVYGNFTGQKTNTTLQAIHNSELLAYIKGTLLAMTVDDPFKKGLYNEYLASQTEVNTFMQGLVLAGAIKPNPVVICDATNNTADVSRAKIKLIHIEYTGVDCLDKVVFDLNLD